MGDLVITTDRAKELLGTVRHAAMATINEDGSPHNTAFHYVIDDAREHIYWASSPESLHSQNLAHTGQAFIVIYEAGKGGGLYLQTENAHELVGDELKQGLGVWNAQRARAGRPKHGAQYFTGESAQRMYRTEITKYWVNYSEKDEQGNVLRDARQEITREDLLV